jgi:mannose-6-phosphate isomerase-like protein (cupin superfamily)
VVLKGMLRVEHEGGAMDVRAGQSVVQMPDEWVRYSSPEPDGAEYVTICLPAFRPTRCTATRRNGLGHAGEQ